MTYLLSILASVWLILSPPPAVADISGQDNHRYQEALEAWLSGTDDLGALQRLAGLAIADNLAAQITLGMLRKRYEIIDEVARSISQEEFRAIMTKPDGRFGERWLEVAAPSSPFARLLLSREVADYASHAIALADEGAIYPAITSARVALNIAASSREDVVSALNALMHPKIVAYTKSEVRFFANMEISRRVLHGDGENAKELIGLLIELPEPNLADRMLQITIPDILARGQLGEDKDKVRFRGQVLMIHPDLQAVVQFLSKTCTEDTAYHFGLLYYSRRGFPISDALISPLEPIVTTDRWRASGRFAKDFLKMIRPTEPHLKNLKQLSPCLYRLFAKA